MAHDHLARSRAQCTGQKAAEKCINTYNGQNKKGLGPYDRQPRKNLHTAISAYKRKLSVTKHDQTPNKIQARKRLKNNAISYDKIMDTQTTTTLLLLLLLLLINIINIINIIIIITIIIILQLSQPWDAEMRIVEMLCRVPMMYCFAFHPQDLPESAKRDQSLHVLPNEVIVNTVLFLVCFVLLFLLLLLLLLTAH